MEGGKYDKNTVELERKCRTHPEYEQPLLSAPSSAVPPDAASISPQMTSIITPSYRFILHPDHQIKLTQKTREPLCAHAEKGKVPFVSLCFILTVFFLASCVLTSYSAAKLTCFTT